MLGCSESDQLTHQARLETIESQAKKLRRIVRIDSIRRTKSDKVSAIIERFNPEMSRMRKAKITDQIIKMALKYDNLDINLLCAMITHESARRWNPKAVSHAGALGLMQIMPKTGKGVARSAGIEWTTPRKVLFDPILNIKLGARYLSRLIAAYDLEAALAAYNGGLRRTEEWMAQDKQDDILPEETENYIPFVLNLYDQFNNSAM